MRQFYTAAITVAVFLVSVRSTLGQGELSPTGGPAPSMVTLDQLQQKVVDGEPRTPINSIPYTITESGSYYLTTNLSGSWHGIIIQGSDVTLDLMGFTLTGDGGPSDGRDP